MGSQGKNLGGGNSGAKWGQWDRNLGEKAGVPRAGIWGVRGGYQSKDFSDLWGQDLGVT